MADERERKNLLRNVVIELWKSKEQEIEETLKLVRRMKNAPKRLESYLIIIIAFLLT
jgi:hypothetical protein